MYKCRLLTYYIHLYYIIYIFFYCRPQISRLTMAESKYNAINEEFRMNMISRYVHAADRDRLMT